MTPEDFPQANATFGKPADLTDEQCNSIRAYKGHLTTGPLAGHQVVVTAYKPSEADLALLNAGGLVYLSVLGGLPPHILATDFQGATLGAETT